MHIEQPHELGRREAIERIDSFLDGLMRQKPPAGITVKNPEKSWNGNTMSFSFTASKGFFGTSINGLLQVEDDRVIMDTELPALVKGVVGEDRIREAISSELSRLLEAPGRA